MPGLFISKLIEKINNKKFEFIYLALKFFKILINIDALVLLIIFS